MNLFSPERPEALPGRKALLDGNIVPTFSLVMLDATTVQLSAHLRNHGESERSYSYKAIELDNCEIAGFFSDFTNDPELTLRLRFGWTPRAQAQPRPKPTYTFARQPQIDLI